MNIYSEPPLTSEGREWWVVVTQWGDSLFTGRWSGGAGSGGPGDVGITLCLDLMGFYGDLMGFYGDLMGFYGILW